MHEIGKRDNQEDCMYPSMASLSDDCRSFVVCDGLGGHDSGEVASAAVCRAIGTYIEKNCNTGAFAHEDFLKALSAAYDELDACDTGARKKMGTTMTFLNFGTAGCLVAHIGDSRVYHMRPGDGILFETRDHSLVNDLLKMGELTPEEAKVFPQRNTVTRCMQPGREVRPKADIRHIADVRAGITGNLPRELQNVHADGAGFEREQGYLYPHNYPGHWVKQQYLPDELVGRCYYEYGDNKTEQAAKRYWDEIKKQ